MGTGLSTTFYVLRIGMPWRYLPRGLPPWPTVYHYSRIWRREGVWEQVLQALEEMCPWPSGRQPSRSAILDGQSAKTTEGGPGATMPARR